MKTIQVNLTKFTMWHPELFTITSKFNKFKREYKNDISIGIGNYSNFQ